MNYTRKAAILAITTALISPRAAFAQSQGCASEKIDIPRNFGRDLSNSVIASAVVGGVLAATAVALLPAIGTVGGIAVFAGFVTFRGVLPSLRRGADDAFASFDHSLNMMQVQ